MIGDTKSSKSVRKLEGRMIESAKLLHTTVLVPEALSKG